MTKAEFRRQLKELLSQSVSGLDSWEARVSYLIQSVVEIDKTRPYDQSNRKKSWTDDEIRLVLQHAPTKENIARLNRAFRRGPGSVEQIFRWVAKSDRHIRQKRPNDLFIQQIKRLAAELGWRAT